jgi:glycosyl transferase family 25
MVLLLLNHFSVADAPSAAAAAPAAAAADAAAAAAAAAAAPAAAPATPSLISVAYVINLTISRDRLADVMKMGRRENLDITRFNAVNGRELSANDPYIHKFFSNKNKLKPGQKGCSLSHIKVWEQVAAGTADVVLILEDDAIIPKDFNRKLEEYMTELPKDWDMVLLGGNNIVGKRYSPRLLYADNTIKRDGNYGLFGYLIKKSTASKLLVTCLKMKATIDTHLNRKFYKNHKVFFCNPQIITHNYNYYSNILQRKRTSDESKNNIIKVI